MSDPAPSERQAPARSQDAPPAVAAWVAGIAAATVSWVLAAGQVTLSRGFEARDLAPFAAWSGLFGICTAGASRFLMALTAGHGLTVRYLIAAAAGVLTAFGFTIFVAAVLGPWVGGFGFPILAYWAVGGVAGQCLAVRMTEDLT